MSLCTLLAQFALPTFLHKDFWMASSTSERHPTQQQGEYTHRLATLEDLQMIIDGECNVSSLRCSMTMHSILAGKHEEQISEGHTISINTAEEELSVVQQAIRQNSVLIAQKNGGMRKE
jgi:hypothetical protein